MSARAAQRRARRPQFVMGMVSAGLLLGLSLTSCSGVPTESPANDTVPSDSAAPEPSATPASDPTLLPDGTAAENLMYFNFLAAAVTKANPAADGRAYIDALVAGGFDRAAMEVTFDRTQADLAADSIQFSVSIADECLIGQIGPASDGFHSVVAPILSTGLCLVGSTRQID
ncbi:DUF6993 domain-containing protein [Cryobacterium serini]|uniref:DUF6993 domain-containing protein n=1 Tax=Cryobacterium serini TaxID=1259201 RepID=A0A4R9BQW7_9MICO|nr:hypothetical protein [Cryobacterium serini]TFD88950.1 hypothetical protein E3T51_06380 [Cryobacterium serini]